MNSVERLTQGESAEAKVAGELMHALDEHLGGLSGILDNFRQNDMEQHVQKWATGQKQSATPQEIQQGLAGTGLIERVAQKAGVSPQLAEMAMRTVLPMVIAHSPRAAGRRRRHRLGSAVWLRRF